MRHLDKLTRIFTTIVPLAAAAVLMVSAATDTWGAYDVQIQAKDRTCGAQWCQPGQGIRDAEASIREQVTAATVGRECWTGNTGRVPSVLVVHADGTTVVQVVPFAAGMKAAQAGRVWVDAACA